ncbi:hypothetical protein BDP27DRAFT_1320489 [Rhodocollybia butyracea]|uniref:Uncharacterized protein n=1 Tax=Rhodocollybia butyracea TaxID=206335 RepID=A0A9P5PYW8_9AGAR|nr:hypothetical protein BDP27DRAFT_1320489 [Rhodocollybia butyracea]
MFAASLEHLLQPQSQGKPKTASESFAEKLRAIGGLSVQEYLNTPDRDIPPIRYDFGLSDSPWYYQVNIQKNAPGLELSAFQKLENTFREVFGNADGLVFEDSKVSGERVCVLHVVKNDKARRTYTVVQKLKTQDQAKEEAAQMALNDGAIAYITGRKPVDDVDVDVPMDDELVDSSDPVTKIEKCFTLWRPGLKAPQWFTYVNGAALLIQLRNQRRVYSTPENTASDSQLVCAQIALDSGVLEFIKHSDGQTHPSSLGLSVTSEEEDQIPCLSVQDFMTTLPRPFPESDIPDDAQWIEANIMDWFNKTLQTGNKLRNIPLTPCFHFFEAKPWHGCLLRIEDPSGEFKEVLNYLVEPRFSKRNKAKMAVCLQAMSEGVGNFLRVTRALPPASTPLRKANSVANPAAQTQKSTPQASRTGTKKKRKKSQNAKHANAEANSKVNSLTSASTSTPRHPTLVSHSASSFAAASSPQSVESFPTSPSFNTASTKQTHIEQAVRRKSYYDLDMEPEQPNVELAYGEPEPGGIGSDNKLTAGGSRRGVGLKRKRHGQ